MKLIAFLALLLTAGIPCSDIPIDLFLGWEFREIDIGARFEIDLFAVSTEPTDLSIAAMDVIVTWNPAEIEFVEVQDTNDWMLTSPPANLPDPFNESFLDGDLRLTALARLGEPVFATSQGLKVATLVFHAIAKSDSSPIVIEPVFGNFITRVFGGDCANHIVTGNLHDADISIIPPQSCDPSVLREFFLLQSCYTGSTGTYPENPEMCCDVYDRDDDGDIDEHDYVYFVGTK